MTFTHPQALWLLALAVPLLLVHFYRGRVRRLQVPTLLFWDQVLAEDHRASALKRLRHWLTLLLALAALALLATALADPSVRGWTPEARTVAIVVDTAPELAAREPDGGTRLDAARARARELVAGLYRLSPVALYDASGLVEPATTDRHALERALGRLPRGLAPRPAGEIAAAAGAAHPGARVVVFTARAVGPVDDGVSVVPVGTPQPNRSLVDAQAAGTEVSARAVNASESAADVTLVVRNRGRVVEERRLHLGPGASERVTWRAEPRLLEGEGAFVELALVPEDAFPADDAAHFTLPPPGPPPLVVVARAEPDVHLLAALRALQPRARVIRPEQVEEVRAELGPSAVWVFDRADPPAGFDGSALLVACGPMGPAVENPRLADWDRRAAVHELVDYEGVAVRRAHLLEGEPLVLSDRGPVAVIERAMGRGRLQFGFAFGVADGDFALQPSFPIFLRNAVAWLGGEGRRAFPREARVGEVVTSRAALPAGVGEALVTTVRGDATSEDAVRVDRGGVRFQPWRPGLVRIQVGSHTEWMVVRPAGSPDLRAVPAASGPPRPEPLPAWRNLPYVAVAGALVLLILLAEWWLFQRRG